MFKKKTIKIISPIALLLIFAVTNPTYSQHEKRLQIFAMHHKKVVIWLYVHWGTEVKKS